MKKKVNVNRGKISSEEIASQKNFKSLIKRYPHIGNPFLRSSWRTKGILWIVILIAILVYCAVQGLL